MANEIPNIDNNSPGYGYIDYDPANANAINSNYGLVSRRTLSGIANAIREKVGGSRHYYPADMPQAIRTIETMGGGYSYPVIDSLRAFGPIDHSNMYDFIIRNSPVVGENWVRYDTLGYVNYGNLSPDTFKFFRYLTNEFPGHEGALGYVYGLEAVNSNTPVNNFSILEMNGIISRSSYINHAFCGPHTISLENAFTYCSNIIDAVCGDNVRYMDNAYSYCYKLVNAVCGNNVLTMRNAYSPCENIVEGICGPNVVNMYYAYGNCRNLVNLTIGPKVKDISNVAINCGNLNIVFVESPNVVNGVSAFSNCANLTDIVGNFGDLENACGMFYNCWNFAGAADVLLNANNLIDTSYMFVNCPLLEAIVLPIGIQSAVQMFNNCQNLEICSGGDNIMAAQNMFWNCRHLRTGPWLNNAANMYATFSNCVELESAYVGDYVADMSYSFANCYNLNSIQYLGESVNNMQYAFSNCYNLPEYNIPNNATDIMAAFANCTSLSGNVIIPENVMYLSRAFEGCENIQNAVILSPVLNNTSYRTANCFKRINFDTRRNIVLTNRSAFNNFVYCNGAGNFTKTNETYQEAIEVEIENTVYNVVRCSYNTQYNCYIYCTE